MVVLLVVVVDSKVDLQCEFQIISFSFLKCSLFHCRILNLQSLFNCLKYPTWRCNCSASSAVDGWFDPGSNQIIQIDSCCLSCTDAAIWSKNKDQLAQIMCPRGATCLLSDCCFGEMALKIQLREFVWYRVGTITICQKVTVSHHDTVNKSLM